MSVQKWLKRLERSARLAKSSLGAGSHRTTLEQVVDHVQKETGLRGGSNSWPSFQNFSDHLKWLAEGTATYAGS